MRRRPVYGVYAAELRSRDLRAGKQRLWTCDHVRDVPGERGVQPRQLLHAEDLRRSDRRGIGHGLRRGQPKLWRIEVVFELPRG